GQFNCDPSRIYLEGLGPGGEAAAQLAALYGDIFAAVAVRNGYPRKPELTSGMERVPTMFLMREGSELTTAGRKAFFDDMMKRAKDVGIENDIKIVTLPALEKVTPKDMAGCAVEPLLDATDDVVAFLEPHRLVSYPDTIRVTTNDRNFSKRAWVRLRRFEVGDGDTVVDLKGKIDKKTNTIELEAENVFAFTFFLNDVLLDLDRPVTVMVNGRTAYIGTVERKLETMLDDYRTYPFLTHRSYSASLLVEVKEEALAPETPKEDGQGAGEEAGGK
ncbi:MAG: hypothetical protein KDB53_14975, partial [Planctomycetes bacterium]|nr:hypothetical protein [Planctomycetota bacterium]